VRRVAFYMSRKSNDHYREWGSVAMRHATKWRLGQFKRDQKFSSCDDAVTFLLDLAADILDTE